MIVEHNKKINSAHILLEVSSVSQCIFDYSSPIYFNTLNINPVDVLLDDMNMPDIMVDD